MQVFSGASWETPTGQWSKFSLTLEECDYEAYCSEEGIHPESLSLKQKFKIMQQLADRMVAAKLASVGAIPLETAQEQIRGIDVSLARALASGE